MHSIPLASRQFSSHGYGTELAPGHRGDPTSAEPSIPWLKLLLKPHEHERARGMA
jgi:hypothetical protein